jgi:hypothetical protein
MTGSNEALTQAEISSFSGDPGYLAYAANATAQFTLGLLGRGDQYPGTTDQFSLQIATDLFNRIQTDVNNGGTGVFGDKQIFDLAQQQWINNNVGDFFPGNVVDSERGGLTMQSVLGAPWGTLLVDGVAGLMLGTFKAGAAEIGGFPPVPVPPGGQQITTPDGQATYIIDSAGNVVSGSVERTDLAPQRRRRVQPCADRRDRRQRRRQPDRDHRRPLRQRVGARPSPAGASEPKRCRRRRNEPTLLDASSNSTRQVAIFDRI